MTGSLQIRPATPDDFDAWLPLWDGYNRFYQRVGDAAVPPDVTRLTWTRFFDGLEPMHALVAARDGKLLGFAHYLYHRHTTMVGPTCYLQDLFTHESERGKGIGRALIERVYEAARAARAERVYWTTHETNTTAMRLYDDVAERSGFVVYRKAL
jgi:GNAT superfamily N-acetyltransferase